jgi:hypothetical protein
VTPASRDWQACRPLWFRLPRALRITSILAALALAPLRPRWSFEPERIRALILVRDLHSALVPLVEALLAQGLQASHILLLDSGSTSSGCLATLAELESRGCRWLRLSPQDQRYGPYAPWLSASLQSEIHSWHYPYLVSDPDLAVPASIPSTWLADLLTTLNRQRFVLKAALPLAINDLTHPQAAAVIRHEQALHTHPAYRLLTRLFLSDHPGAVATTTDTTLALYRPARFFSTLSIRLPPRYQIKHLPWYNPYVNTLEYKYYQAHKLKLFGEWSSEPPAAPGP